MLLLSRPFTDADIDDLLESAERVLAGQDERIDIDSFLLVVEEVMDNAVRHSGESGGTFAIERIGEYIVARVEDGGVGIHHNMSRQYPGLSEDRAVALAFQPGAASNGASAPRPGLSLVAGYTARPSGPTLCLFTGETAYLVADGEGTVLSSSDSHQGVVVVCLRNNLACSACHRRPSRRSASSTYRCGYAFVSGPCEERRCRRIPHRRFTDRPLAELHYRTTRQPPEPGR